MLRLLAAAAFSVTIPVAPLVLLAAVTGSGDDAPGLPGDPSALAKALGIHVKAAIRWQKISGGDWAADVGGRLGH